MFARCGHPVTAHGHAECQRCVPPMKRSKQQCSVKCWERNCGRSQLSTPVTAPLSQRGSSGTRDEGVCFPVWEVLTQEQPTPCSPAGPGVRGFILSPKMPDTLSGGQKYEETQR